jgi:hypothetical protein
VLLSSITSLVCAGMARGREEALHPAHSVLELTLRARRALPAQLRLQLGLGREVARQALIEQCLAAGSRAEPTAP